jgi:hypothetical protein
VSTSDSGVTDLLDAPLCFRRWRRAWAASIPRPPTKDTIAETATLCVPLNLYKSNAPLPCHRNPHSTLNSPPTTVADRADRARNL